MSARIGLAFFTFSATVLFMSIPELSQEEIALVIVASIFGTMAALLAIYLIFRD